MQDNSIAYRHTRQNTFRTVTVDIETDYPAQLQVGTRIHSGGGFLIGTIVAVGENWDGEIGRRF